MSNLFRANWKKKDKRKSSTIEDQNSKTSRKVQPPPPLAPQATVPAGSKKAVQNESPVHVAIACTPPSPLVTNKAQAKRDGPTYLQAPVPPVSKVTVYVDLRQDIINTTADVQKFLCAVSKLKESMGGYESSLPNQNQSDESSSHVLDSIKQIIQTVHDCLDAHPGMQSTEILNTTTALSETLKSCNHQNYSTCPNCSAAIEQLIDSFSSSIAAYMTGDSLSDDQGAQTKMIHVSSSTNLVKGFSKSHESLQAAAKYGSMMDLASSTADPVVDEIDRGLAKIEQNVQTAAGYVKAKLRYHQEVVHYFSKRAQLELKHHQKMEQLCKSTEAMLQEIRTQEQYVPLEDVLSSSMDVDRKVAASFSVTYSNQTTVKLIEPLEKKNEENDKTRKDYQQRWQKELKKLTEAKTALKSAQTKYRMLGDDLHKVRNLLAADPFGKQADKRKKEIYELELKWEEAESSYKQAVAHCNDCQYQVHVTAQKSILFGYRRMVIDMDTMLKNGLSQYCSLQENMFRTLPESLAPYRDKMVDYEIGKDFVHYIGKCKQSSEEPEDFHFEEYDPNSDVLNLSDAGGLSTSTSQHSNLLAPTDDTSVRDKPSSPIQVPPQAWDRMAYSKDEIVTLTSSPLSDRRKPRPHSVAFIGQEPPSIDLQSQRSSPMRRSSDQFEPLTEKDIEEPRSKSAFTHTFKRLRTPAKCRQCDTYVYFNGYECDKCGLACHNLCLEHLMIICGNKKLPKKIPIFGVQLQEYLQTIKRRIPIVVTKCIKELDERGLSIQGVYRISTAKSKLDKLCQLFESGADRIDLSEVPPHLVGSCLKFYFRQLPEPLLTFELYHEFIAFAKEATPYLPCDFKKVTPEKEPIARDMLKRLRELLRKLPAENYCSMARLLYHLSRVGSPENSKLNFMPPSNLGIVFGPNLLRQRDMVASLALLADMTVQAKAIEILISHIHDVCPVTEDKLVEMEEEQTSSIILGDTEMPVDVEDVTSPTDTGLSENEESVVLKTQISVTTPPERRKQAISKKEDILAEFQMASPSHTSPPGSQSLSFNYQLPSVTPNDHALQPRRSNNSIAPPSSSLAPVFERQLENEQEDSYDPEIGSNWDGDEPSDPDNLPILPVVHSSGSLSGYTTSESLNDFDTYDDLRRSRGVSNAPLNTHSLGFHRSIKGALPFRRHLSCSVGALDRIAEPVVSREFEVEMVQILQNMKPSSPSSSSEEEEEAKNGGLSALCDPESAPASPASFSVHSSEENTPVNLTSIHLERVARRRSYEMNSDGFVSSNTHPRMTKPRPLSSDTYGFKSEQRRATLSATSSPIGSIRRGNMSSCSEEQLVTTPAVSKLNIPRKYSRYEQPSLLPSPTPGGESQSENSVDYQMAMSSADDQGGVSIDDQGGVSIDDQESVFSSDEPGCVSSEPLIGEEEVPPLPDDSSSKPLRVQSLFLTQDFGLGSSPSTGLGSSPSTGLGSSSSTGLGSSPSTGLGSSPSIGLGSPCTGGFPMVRSPHDVIRNVGGSPCAVVPPEQSHTPCDVSTPGNNNEVHVTVHVDLTMPKETSKEESLPTPGSHLTENAVTSSTNQPMEAHNTLPQQPVVKPLGEAMEVSDTENLSSHEASTPSVSDQMITSHGISTDVLTFTNESTQNTDDVKGKSLVTPPEQVTTANGAIIRQVTMETNHLETTEKNGQVTMETGSAEQPISADVPQMVITSAMPPQPLGGFMRSPPIRIRTLKVTPSNATSDYTADQKLETQQCSRVRMISPEELREPMEGGMHIRRSHTHDSFVDNQKAISPEELREPMEGGMHIRRSRTHDSFVDNQKASGSRQCVVTQGHKQSNKKITVLSVKQSASNHSHSPSFPTIVMVAVDSRRKMTESDAGSRDKPSPKTKRKTRTPHFV